MPTTWSCRRASRTSISRWFSTSSQTLVVVLYYSVFAAGVRATQSVDAMAVTYMVTTLIWLLIALRFVNPTQLVTRVKEQPKK